MIKKITVDIDFGYKKINLSVNEFYLTKRVPLSVFSHLNCLTNIFELEKIFCLGLSLSFLRHE